jgi:hypothetical protein
VTSRDKEVWGKEGRKREDRCDHCMFYVFMKIHAYTHEPTIIYNKYVLIKLKIEIQCT